MLQYFAVCGERERAQAEEFCLRFGVDAQPVPQGAGITGDYIVSATTERTRELETQLGYPLLGKRIEFKDDKSSLKFNSFFIEYESTSNSWATRQPSGHAKAVLDGCVLVISSGARSFIFNKQAYARLVEGATKTLSTKFRSNGNLPASFTHGKIVPLPWAFKAASFAYVSRPSILPAHQAV